MRNPLVVIATLALLASACDCGGTVTKKGAGELKVEETALDFGSACPKPTSPDLKVETQTRTVHVQNVGVGALTLNKFEVEPSKKDLFTFDASQIPGELASGEALAVDITFTPNAAGTIIGDLTIEGDEEGKAPTVVKLTGKGKDAPANPTMALSCPGGQFSGDLCATANPTMAFQSTLQGSTTEYELKITNNGCPSLSVFNLAVVTDTQDGAGPTVFSLAPGQTALDILGGEMKPLKLLFTPDITGIVNGTLTFETNDPAMKKVTIALKGSGETPVLQLVPDRCDFTTKTGFCNGKFSLSNAGGKDLQVQDVKIKNNNSMFTIVSKPTAGTVIPAAGSGNNTLTDAVVIQYNPSVRLETDYVVVTSTGGGAEAQLYGGSPPVIATTDPAGQDLFTVDFGDSLSQTRDYYLPVLVKNVDTYNRQLPLTLNVVEIEKSATSNALNTFSLAADPTDSTNCPAPPAAGTTVPVGGERRVCVKFRSTTQGGAFYANLHVKTDDPKQPDMLVLLVAASTCNPKPIAEITAPTTLACPAAPSTCAGQAKCVNGFCHATTSTSQTIAGGNNTITLSGAASYDLKPDTATNNACTVEQHTLPFYEWKLVLAPTGSTAAISPTGKVSNDKTQLTMDKLGIYTVQLIVYDDTGLASNKVTFQVTAK